MKIVVYTADSEVPFNEFYKPLSGWTKIIFSNKKEIRFDENAVKALSPKGIRDSNDASIRYIPDEDDSIFFVPLEMKDMFTKQLKRLFKTTKWEDIAAQKPSKEELGLGGSGDKLAQFYDKIVKVVEILVPKRKCSNKELENLLNKIVQEENLINAVFVLKNGILCKNTTDIDKEKLLYNYLDFIGAESTFLNNFGKKTSLGEPREGTFLMRERVLNMYYLGELSTTIGFISGMPMELTEFLLRSKKYLNDINIFLQLKENDSLESSFNGIASE